MTGECPNCRVGSTCPACLDFIHNAHRANGTDHVPSCVRCKPLPRNRAERRRADRRSVP